MEGVDKEKQGEAQGIVHLPIVHFGVVVATCFSSLAIDTAAVVACAMGPHGPREALEIAMADDLCRVLIMQRLNQLSHYFFRYVMRKRV